MQCNLFCQWQWCFLFYHQKVSFLHLCYKILPGRKKQNERRNITRKRCDQHSQKEEPNLQIIRSRHETCFPKSPSDGATVVRHPNVSISRDKELWHLIFGTPTLFTVPTCCLLCCIQIRFFLCLSYVLLVSYPLVSKPIWHLKHMQMCGSKHVCRSLWLALHNRPYRGGTVRNSALWPC